MVISHKYKFIFVKTAKTAGTSIEVLLSGHCSEDDVLTPIEPPVESHRERNDRGFFNPLPEILRGCTPSVRKSLNDLIQRKKFYNHIPAALIRARIPSGIWDSYTTFCVERNPWDKTLSHYHMLRYRAGGSLSLDEYFRRGEFCLNHHRYTDSEGSVIVDRILRFEELQPALSGIFKTLGIPGDGTLGNAEKSEFRDDRRHYRDVLSREQRNLIASVFSQEIEMHGYDY
jgi:hypothetical protein